VKFANFIDVQVCFFVKKYEKKTEKKSKKNYLSWCTGRFFWQKSENSIKHVVCDLRGGALEYRHLFLAQNAAQK